MDESGYKKLKEIINEYKYNNLNNLLRRLEGELKNKNQSISFFIKFIKKDSDNSCECNNDDNDDIQNLKCLIKAQNDEVVIAHEVAHQFSRVYDCYNFDDLFGLFEDFLVNLSIEHNEIISYISNIRDSIFNIGQHFIVKRELEKNFTVEGIEERWVGKNGQRKDLFNTGEFLEPNLQEKKGQNYNILNSIIRLEKALIMSDLCFALSFDKQNKFNSTIHTKINNDTLNLFNLIKDEIEIDKNYCHRENMFKLYFNFLCLLKNYCGKF